MRRFLAVLALCVAIASAQVLDLTPDNFDDALKDKGAFVEFFAPWCGHCKNLAPAYDIVGEAFAKSKDVVIAKVDADAHKELGSRFDVHGFPTLKWFPKGASSTPEDYNGGRTAEDIIGFINNKAGTNAKVKKAPSNVVDLTDANFDSIVLNGKKDVLAEFYAPWCGHCKKLIPDYEKLSNAFAGDSNVVIAKLDADNYKDLAGKYGVSGFPTLLWFGKNNKENPEKYERGRDVQNFVDFINEKAGTKRTASGKLQSTAGRIDALDAIASKVAAGTEVATLIRDAEDVVKTLSGEAEKHGKIYVKTLESIKSKGKDFVNTESARLAKMLDGSLTPAKVDEFTIRQNILSAFN